jgi:hypothetical protein
LERHEWFTAEGQGYSGEQKTKPATLGFAFADSPVALLAWIYEKLHDWTDDYKWTDDEIITWISIYAFSTAGPAAASYIYYEATHDNAAVLPKGAIPYIDRANLGEYIAGPLGLAYFPKELGGFPRTWGRTMGDVVFEGEYERGGHFAAHEFPEAIVDGLRKMFGKEGGAVGVVEGKSGY